MPANTRTTKGLRRQFANCAGSGWTFASIQEGRTPMSESPTPRWLTQEQTCQYLGGCSPRHIQALRREGKIPVSYALGERSPRYDRLELDRWMASGQQPETQTPRLAVG
jgi:predicted DNA-binding transcriptional regulator AlpA